MREEVSGSPHGEGGQEGHHTLQLLGLGGSALRLVLSDTEGLGSTPGESLF